MTINYSFASCNLGNFLVAQNNNGHICYLSFTNNTNELVRLFPNNTLINNSSLSIVIEVIKYIDDLLHSKNPFMTFKLDLHGTNFQMKVWKVLLDTPNKIFSYSDIAELIKSPNSVRAVAQACAANNIAILVPCHKIIRKDGNLSGYRWGIDKKHILINAITNK